MDVRLKVEEFASTCEVILARPGLSPEVSYRIRKLMERVAPVSDRVYLKTLKGGETLLKCIEKAEIVGAHLDAEDESLYRLITDLEITCEALLTVTYEFRIKAG